MSSKSGRPTKPRSEAQVEASRRNGAKSRGPKTAAGRERSSQNSRTHGLTAGVRFIASQEDQEEFNQLLAGYVTTCEPANTAENELVAEIARCAWKLQRIGNIEGARFDHWSDLLKDQLNERRRPLENMDRLAYAFSKLANNSEEMVLLCRYESNARRGLYAAMNALAKAQEQRRRRQPAVFVAPTAKLPNEPNPQPADDGNSLQYLGNLKVMPARVPAAGTREMPGFLPEIPEALHG